jgi:hypothetical protein
MRRCANHPRGEDRVGRTIAPPQHSCSVEYWRPLIDEDEDDEDDGRGGGSIAPNWHSIFQWLHWSSDKRRFRERSQSCHHGENSRHRGRWHTCNTSQVQAQEGQGTVRWEEWSTASSACNLCRMPSPPTINRSRKVVDHGHSDHMTVRLSVRPERWCRVFINRRRVPLRFIPRSI